MVAADPLAGWWRRTLRPTSAIHGRTQARAVGRRKLRASDARTQRTRCTHARTLARSHASVLSTCARLDTECQQQQLSRRSHSAAGVAWRSGNGSLDSTRSSWRRCSSSSCSLRSLGPATSTACVRLAAERRRRAQPRRSAETARWILRLLLVLREITICRIQRRRARFQLDRRRSLRENTDRKSHLAMRLVRKYRRQCMRRYRA